VYNVDTTKGQSGSPVFLWTQNLGREESFYVVGVHSGYFGGSEDNYGALVTSSMVERIKEWHKEMLSEENKEEANSFNICEVRGRKVLDLETYQKRPEP
jgi:glycerate-2-kinase